MSIPSVPDPRRHHQLQTLLLKLGLPEDIPVQWFRVDLALTHSTFSSEANYEQLEFVGDAVVRLVATEFLFEAYPQASVGEYTALRAILVSDRTLTEIANRYGLDRYLRIGASAAKDSRGESSRLAESLEALLGALYLSTHNLNLIRPWLDGHLKQLAEAVRSDPARQNYKAALQAWTQAHYHSLPEYRVQETGQIHDPHRFTAAVWVQGSQVGQGIGQSIKAAEKAAAEEAFLKLQTELDRSAAVATDDPNPGT